MFVYLFIYPRFYLTIQHIYIYTSYHFILWLNLMLNYVYIIILLILRLQLEFSCCKFGYVVKLISFCQLPVLDDPPHFSCHNYPQNKNRYDLGCKISSMPSV